jgi:type VI secretion system secreted protein VgrG
MKSKATFLGAALALSCVGAIGLSQRADATCSDGILCSAESFAVLGASAVTNTDATTIYGNLGIDPNGLSSITGFPPGVVLHGTTDAANGVALTAQNDAMTAYTTLMKLAPTLNLTGQDLGGMTLGPGVYNFSSSAQLTGTLTLDFTGKNQDIVFQIGSTLTTAGASKVIINGAGPTDGVFFDVGSSATLGTTTSFEGNILANTSITLDTGATILCGRAFALNGAVTMDTNKVSDNCEGRGSLGSGVKDRGGFSGGNFGGSTVSAPEIDPASAASGLTLLLGSLLVLRGRMRVPPSRSSLA